MGRPISRQTFLRGAAGALATGALLGSGRAAADPGIGWAGLDSSIGGKVLLPANGAFTSAKQVFNSLYDGSSPAAVVTVTSRSDV